MTCVVFCAQCMPPIIKSLFSQRLTRARHVLFNNGRVLVLAPRSIVCYFLIYFEDRHCWVRESYMQHQEAWSVGGFSCLQKRVFFFIVKLSEVLLLFSC